MYWGPFVLDHCRKWLCTTFSQQTIVPCVLLAENVKLPILPVALQKLEAETGCSLVWAGPAAKAGRSFREHTAGIVFSQSVFFFPMKSPAVVPRGRHMFPSRASTRYFPPGFHSPSPASISRSTATGRITVVRSNLHLRWRCWHMQRGVRCRFHGKGKKKWTQAQENDRW
jgi:hypothetical protein